MFELGEAREKGGGRTYRLPRPAMYPARESADMLQQELNNIGFNLRGTQGAGDIARVLYPHHVGHPIGVGMSSQLYIPSFLTYSVKICTSQAITTETEV